MNGKPQWGSPPIVLRQPNRAAAICDFKMTVVKSWIVP
jgi:hypothetical protein